MYVCVHHITEKAYVNFRYCKIIINDIWRFRVIEVLLNARHLMLEEEKKRLSL